MEESKAITKDNNNNYPKLGETVLLYIDNNLKNIITLDADKAINITLGNFPHSYFLGSEFGTKIYSKNKKGFVYILPLSRTLWTENLLHKTQILYSLDISNIIFLLNIKRGSYVAESGTGSGSLTFSIAKKIGGDGVLNTFEFNKERSDYAKQNFIKLGLSQVSVFNRDVYADGFSADNIDFKIKKYDAIFVDLPSPWSSITHLKTSLRKGGRLCSFSPCIEQVMKMKISLSENGFGDFQTIELLERSYIRKKLYLKKLKDNTKLSEEENMLNNNNLLSKRENNYIHTPTHHSEKTHTGYLTFCTKFTNN